MPKQSRKAKTPPAKNLSPARFVIGVGSSAGGLEALSELVSSLPMDFDACFVVVQHMSPQHKSLMTALISRETKLEVKDVIEDTEVHAGEVYVTPPNTDIVFEKGKLRLKNPSNIAAKPKPSVDRFLTSLAEEKGENSMAIILSGTGSDGAYGIQAIRAAGGITIAQDTISAKYDGMPNSAVETGCVDLVLRPSEIGKHLKKLLKSPRNFEKLQKQDTPKTALSDLLQILFARTRVDFREYKHNTVERRIERRMIALGIGNHADYTNYCRHHPNEVDALFKDLLISVTRFFRDKEEFDALQRSLEKLVREHESETIRVWVAGCATGEEAYSVAMAMAEAVGGPEELRNARVQIFATDIDRAAMQSARRAFYPISALDDVPEDLAEKYFVHHQDGVKVIEALRSIILFSEHNLCQDPPFLNLDLICCRNVLIYFGSPLQARVLTRMHHGLRDKGILFLGRAETVSGTGHLFMRSQDKFHIYRKRFLGRTTPPVSEEFLYSFSKPRPIKEKISEKSPSTDRLMLDALIKTLGHNAIMVGDRHSILRLYGNLSKYIELSDQSDLGMKLSLLAKPYRDEARSLVTLALKHSDRRLGKRHLSREKGEKGVRLEAFPIEVKELEEKVVLLVFHEIDEETPEAKEIDISQFSEALDGNEIQRIQELDSELSTTKEALQQTVEELETTNEEMQSTNEELQSSNEELQATNEELETSNEELQSTNEELITVNEELQVNAAELTETSAELNTVLQRFPNPILVVDTALQIVRFSEKAGPLFNLRTDAPYPHLSQVALPIEFPKLTEICASVVQNGTPIKERFAVDGQEVELRCNVLADEKKRVFGATLFFSGLDEQSKKNHNVDAESPFRKVCFSMDDKVLQVSQKMLDKRKLAPENVLGKPLAKTLTKVEVEFVGKLKESLVAQCDKDNLPEPVRFEPSKTVSGGFIWPRRLKAGKKLVFHCQFDA